MQLLRTSFSDISKNTVLHTNTQTPQTSRLHSRHLRTLDHKLIGTEKTLFPGRLWLLMETKVIRKRIGEASPVRRKWVSTHRNNTREVELCHKRSIWKLERSHTLGQPNTWSSAGDGPAPNPSLTNTFN